jgi:hypothetical protein
MVWLPGISHMEEVRMLQNLGCRIVGESVHLILSNGEGPFYVIIL